jgi:hypothetical protein
VVGEQLVVPVFLFACIAAVWTAFILTRHKEKMAMIEKGTGAEDIKSLYARGAWRSNPLSSLKWGMICVGVGLAILLGMWLRDAYMVSEGVFPGLIALFGGLGLIVFYFTAHRKAQ